MEPSPPVSKDGGIGPLPGCYLLIVVSEPHTDDHREKIIQKIRKGLLSWDIETTGCDLKGLENICDSIKEAGEIDNELLLQYSTELLAVEILVQPQVNTLKQCLKNLLVAVTGHKHLIHAGYAFSSTGSWILQDGTFSFGDFVDAFQDADVQTVLMCYPGCSVHVHCISEGDWTNSQIQKQIFNKNVKIIINPSEKVSEVPGSEAIIDCLKSVLISHPLEQLMKTSSIVGNIRFSRPTLYVFPGGQGDCALFGVSGFNMLFDGGYTRKPCFWEFIRHLDRLDAMVVTRLSESNLCGVTTLLKRKVNKKVYPQIGYVFCNIAECKQSLSDDFYSSKDDLLISVITEGYQFLKNLHHLDLKPHRCLRGPVMEPLTLYHKVGHGTLEMYVLSPSKDGKETREFFHQWQTLKEKFFSSKTSIRPHELCFPLSHFMSICAIIIWKPADPEDTITRIMFPGSAPQNRIFEGLDKLKDLKLLQYRTCTATSLKTTISEKTEFDKAYLKSIAVMKSPSTIPTDHAPFTLPQDIKHKLIGMGDANITDITTLSPKKVQKIKLSKKEEKFKTEIGKKPIEDTVIQKMPTTKGVKDLKNLQAVEQQKIEKVPKDIILIRSPIKKTKEKITTVKRVAKPSPKRKRITSVKELSLTRKIKPKDKLTIKQYETPKKYVREKEKIIKKLKHPTTKTLEQRALKRKLEMTAKMRKLATQKKEKLKITSKPEKDLKTEEKGEKIIEKQKEQIITEEQQVAEKQISEIEEKKDETKTIETEPIKKSEKTKVKIIKRKKPLTQLKQKKDITLITKPIETTEKQKVTKPKKTTIPPAKPTEITKRKETKKIPITPEKKKKIQPPMKKEIKEITEKADIEVLKPKKMITPTSPKKQKLPQKDKQKKLVTKKKKIIETEKQRKIKPTIPEKQKKIEAVPKPIRPIKKHLEIKTEEQKRAEKEIPDTKEQPPSPKVVTKIITKEEIEEIEAKPAVEKVVSPKEEIAEKPEISPKEEIKKEIPEEIEVPEANTEELVEEVEEIVEKPAVEEAKISPKEEVVTEVVEEVEEVEITPKEKITVEKITTEVTEEEVTEEVEVVTKVKKEVITEVTKEDVVEVAVPEPEVAKISPKEEIVTEIVTKEVTEVEVREITEVVKEVAEKPEVEKISPKEEIVAKEVTEVVEEIVEKPAVFPKEEVVTEIITKEEIEEIEAKPAVEKVVSPREEIAEKPEISPKEEIKKEVLEEFDVLETKSFKSDIEVEELIEEFVEVLEAPVGEEPKTSPSEEFVEIIPSLEPVTFDSGKETYVEEIIEESFVVIPDVLPEELLRDEVDDKDFVDGSYYVSDSPKISVSPKEDSISKYLTIEVTEEIEEIIEKPSSEDEYFPEDDVLSSFSRKDDTGICSILETQKLEDAVIKEISSMTEVISEIVSDERRDVGEILHFSPEVVSPVDRYFVEETIEVEEVKASESASDLSSKDDVFLEDYKTDICEDVLPIKKVSPKSEFKKEIEKGKEIYRTEQIEKGSIYETPSGKRMLVTEKEEAIREKPEPSDILKHDDVPKVEALAKTVIDEEISTVEREEPKDEEKTTDEQTKSVTVVKKIFTMPSETDTKTDENVIETRIQEEDGTIRIIRRYITETTTITRTTTTTTSESLEGPDETVTESTETTESEDVQRIKESKDLEEIKKMPTETETDTSTKVIDATSPTVVTKHKVIRKIIRKKPDGTTEVQILDDDDDQLDEIEICDTDKSIEKLSPDQALTETPETKESLDTSEIVLTEAVSPTVTRKVFVTKTITKTQTEGREGETSVVEETVDDTADTEDVKEDSSVITKLIVIRKIIRKKPDGTTEVVVLEGDDQLDETVSPSTETKELDTEDISDSVITETSSPTVTKKVTVTKTVTKTQTEGSEGETSVVEETVDDTADTEDVKEEDSSVITKRTVIRKIIRKKPDGTTEVVVLEGDDQLDETVSPSTETKELDTEDISDSVITETSSPTVTKKVTVTKTITKTQAEDSETSVTVKDDSDMKLSEELLVTPTTSTVTVTKKVIIKKPDGTTEVQIIDDGKLSEEVISSEISHEKSSVTKALTISESKCEEKSEISSSKSETKTSELKQVMIERSTKETTASSSKDSQEPSSSSKTEFDVKEWGKPMGLPSPPEQSVTSHQFEQGAKPKSSTCELPTKHEKFNFEMPLGLPTPPEELTFDNAKISTRHTTKSKVMKSSTLTKATKASEEKRSTKYSTDNVSSPTRSVTSSPKHKLSSKKSRGDKDDITPVYLDLTYVPHHADPHYSNLEFFLRVRARYYVFSGTNPSKEVLNALLEAKRSWEDKDAEVTIIPTYETDTLGYWIALNQDLLAENKIDVAPSANRCTINLQDHETSCAAYRLEF
ncbi:microtubule-associated protein futsch-like isoform X2 [Centruroides sculpturatus]|uniref:microtubule-associated protein futsch-like isoform X2 n=1 Tax=Centruroides sculpturatus TaxID=218467 RepID=UPI000C6E9E21|nr:microtubule-associated protein futsch-like isoform X2 [Centruroides sculpturatus]